MTPESDDIRKKVDVLYHKMLDYDAEVVVPDGVSVQLARIADALEKLVEQAQTRYQRY